MSDSFLKNYVFPALFLAVVSVCTLWQFISTGPIPETPNNDLARHAAAITNFKFAFMDSQYLPRMQLLPSSYPDLPVFQFYGSMLGFLSLPFLAMKLPPLISLMFGLLVIRCLGAFALYATGRMLEANCWASLLASASYLLTPYLISNVYGRVAIPEATAHGLIAVLLYGLVRLAIRKDSCRERPDHSYHMPDERHFAGRSDSCGQCSAFKLPVVSGIPTTQRFCYNFCESISVFREEIHFLQRPLWFSTFLTPRKHLA